MMGKPVHQNRASNNDEQTFIAQRKKQKNLSQVVFT